MDIFVSTTPFGEADPASVDVLREAGVTVEHNPLGRKMKPAEVAEHARHAKVLIAGTEDLTPFLEANSDVGLISRVGVGLDGVPLALCRDRGVRVSWTPEAVSPAVAELTIGLMISATRFVPVLDRGIREGRWRRPSGRRLGDSVIGIMGLGRIGGRVAELLAPFRPLEVLAFDTKDKSAEIDALRAQGLKIRQVGLPELLGASHVVTVHLPNSPSTRNMLSEDAVAAMHPGAVLVNTARGEIVDEEAVAAAAADGRLSGAALDVFHHEPYSGPLTGLDNVILTPHLGSCGLDCRARMELESAEEAVAFLQGRPLQREVPDEEYAYQEQPG